eukprot:SAG11_NODE_1144_length_5695_cov_2.181558_3_plen_115_part_00
MSHHVIDAQGREMIGASRGRVAGCVAAGAQPAAIAYANFGVMQPGGVAGRIELRQDRMVRSGHGSRARVWCTGRAEELGSPSFIRSKSSPSLRPSFNTVNSVAVRVDRRRLMWI